MNTVKNDRKRIQRKVDRLRALASMTYGVGATTAQIMEMVELIAGLDPESNGAVTEAALLELSTYEFDHFAALTELLGGVAVDARFSGVSRTERAALSWRALNGETTKRYGRRS